LILSSANLKALGFFGNVVNPLFGLSYKNSSSQSHASLSTGTESSINDGIKSIFFIAVWHDNTVVLSTHIALCSFSSFTTDFVNVLSGFVSTNE
jgi:hypothetical protein